MLTFGTDRIFITVRLDGGLVNFLGGCAETRGMQGSGAHRDLIENDARVHVGRYPLSFTNNGPLYGTNNACRISQILVVHCFGRISCR